MCSYCSANHDNGKDRPIYVRVIGMGKIHWYVIEEKSPVDLEYNDNSVMLCESDNDRVRRLSFLCSDLSIYDVGSAFSNNLIVLDSTVFLIGGDANTQKKKKKKKKKKKNKAQKKNHEACIAYRCMDLDSGVGEWRQEGGTLVMDQGGGAAVGPDGYIYTVGYNIYRFSHVGKFHEEFESPPSKKQVKEPRLLGISKEKLFIYTIEGGVNGANLMLSFGLDSGKWDILDDDKFRGDWSAGVVLYDDQYLFSFCTRNPTRQEEAEVPGIYVFDIKNRTWLPEPVEGLPLDGMVLPFIYTPDSDSEEYVDDTFTPFLLQIRNQNEHKLALLYDGHGIHPESHAPQLKLVWSKFVLSRRTKAADEDPHFYANSISSGLCPLDDYTFRVINCEAGM